MKINEIDNIMLDLTNTKSISLARLPFDKAAVLAKNLRIVGTFTIADEGAEDFIWQNSRPDEFINVARDAAKQYCRTRHTKFARLVVVEFSLLDQ